MQLKCNVSAVNARGGGLKDPSLNEGNSIAYMLLTGSVWTVSQADSGLLFRCMRVPLV